MASSMHHIDLPEMKPTVLSEAEIDRLPVCIQKYFSSPAGSNGPSSVDLNNYNLSPTHHLRSLSQPQGQGRSRVLKKGHSSWESRLAQQADTTWFLSLPDKVRRQYFSCEEKHLLVGPIDRSTAASPAPNKRQSPTLSSRPRPSTSSAYSTMPYLDERRSPTHASNPSSIRRTFSVSRNSSTSSPLPVSRAMAHKRNWSRSGGAVVSLARPSVELNAAVFDPDAVYYRDPGARSKLRQYLASPQKFDEAVAFGFPSSPPTDSEKDPSSPFQSSAHNDAQTFLKEEVLTFMDRYEDMEESDCATSEGSAESPTTPADGEGLFEPADVRCMSIFGSLDVANVPSFSLSFEPGVDKVSLPPPLNREMTLRMTLTRPDLRANEEDLYGWRKDDDPLALEDLPQPTEDTTGAYGAFAVRPRRNSRDLFSKILSKVRKDRRH